MKKLTVTAKEIKTTTRTFLTYYATLPEDKTIKVKFTKGCNNPIRNKGTYILSIDINDISIGKDSYFDKAGQVVYTEVFWIRNVVGCEDVTAEYQAIMQAKEQDKLNALLGDDYE